MRFVFCLHTKLRQLDRFPACLLISSPPSDARCSPTFHGCKRRKVADRIKHSLREFPLGVVWAIRRVVSEKCRYEGGWHHSGIGLSSRSAFVLTAAVSELAVFRVLLRTKPSLNHNFNGWAFSSSQVYLRVSKKKNNCVSKKKTLTLFDLWPSARGPKNYPDSHATTTLNEHNMTQSCK